MVMSEDTHIGGREGAGRELFVRSLYKSYDSAGRRNTVLAGLSFTVKPGEFVTILGASGCGKSTCLRIIAGLDAPDPHPDTQLLLDGTPIRGPGPDRGFVFQAYSSFPWLTVKENVKFGLRFCVDDEAERERRAMEYLDLVRMRDLARRYPRELSGGQQQRVAIARTLAMRPSLLLMDEPFAALDSMNREAQQLELLRIWRESKPTVLFVTHDIAEAALLGQRVLVLGARGSVEAIDTETELAQAADKRGEHTRDLSAFHALTARIKSLLPRAREDGS